MLELEKHGDISGPTCLMQHKLSSSILVLNTVCHCLEQEIPHVKNCELCSSCFLIHQEFLQSIWIYPKHFFLSYQKWHWGCNSLPNSCFPTHPAVLPASHLFLSEQNYLTLLVSFGYLASLCNYVCPLDCAENHSGFCTIFRQQMGNLVISGVTYNHNGDGRRGELQ